MSSNGNLVEVENLRVWFPIKSGIVLDRHIGDIKAVDDVSFEIRRGETLGLVGESGSGRSTVANSILGLTKADSGTIEFEGRSLPDLTRADMRTVRRLLTAVFQDPSGSTPHYTDSGVDQGFQPVCFGPSYLAPPPPSRA